MRIIVEPCTIDIAAEGKGFVDPWTWYHYRHMFIGELHKIVAEYEQRMDEYEKQVKGDYYDNAK